METTTARLTKILKSTKDINTILQENERSIASPTLREYLDNLLSSKDMKRQDVIRRAELDSNNINQLFSGIRTKPGRNQILSLAFGFELNKEETDRLLRLPEWVRCILKTSAMLLLFTPLKTVCPSCR